MQESIVATVETLFFSIKEGSSCDVNSIEDHQARPSHASRLKNTTTIRPRPPKKKTPTTKRTLTEKNHGTCRRHGGKHVRCLRVRRFHPPPRRHLCRVLVRRFHLNGEDQCHLLCLPDARPLLQSQVSLLIILKTRHRPFHSNIVVIFIKNNSNNSKDEGRRYRTSPRRWWGHLLIILYLMVASYTKE